jgi:prevent-host-death family protein
MEVETMKELSVREMRAALGRLDELVEEEGELLVTRHGRPVARVLPATARVTLPPHRALRESLPRLRLPSEVVLEEMRSERA